MTIGHCNKATQQNDKYLERENSTKGKKKNLSSNKSSSSLLRSSSYGHDL